MPAPAAEPAALLPALTLAGVALADAEGRPLLHGIELTLAPGEVVVICGDDEAAKCALLEVAAGLRAPDAGQVSTRDTAAATPAHREAPRAGRPRHQGRPRRSGPPRVGMVFAQGTLLSNQNLYGNLALPLRYHTRLSEAVIEQRVLREAAALSLTEWLDEMPARIGPALRFRANLATVLMLEPAAVALEEPLTGLDPDAAAALADELRALSRDRRLAVLITGNRGAAYGALGDRMLFLVRGALTDVPPPVTRVRTAGGAP